MEKEQRISNFLQEKYIPDAIILHGSRASGMNRAHSDWDIYLIFKEKPAVTFHREEIDHEDVEWHGVMLPSSDNEILETFGVHLQSSKVLWEKDSIGTKLLEKAKTFYARGVRVSKSDRAKYKQYLTHKVHGMADDLNTPYMFLRHQYAFFERASNWWFELRGMYRKPFYTAMPYIQEHDPEYYSLLMQICNAAVSNRDKILVAQSVVQKLFA